MGAIQAEIETKDLANKRNLASPKGNGGERRAWTIKGITQGTVTQSREAAQKQGMHLCLWVEKQLREAAERELHSKETKDYVADLLGTKIEKIEATLSHYLLEQDKKICKLQDEIRMLNTSIVPPLLHTLAASQLKKGGR